MKAMQNPPKGAGKKAAQVANVKVKVDSPKKGNGRKK